MSSGGGGTAGGVGAGATFDFGVTGTSGGGGGLRRGIFLPIGTNGTPGDVGACAAAADANPPHKNTTNHARVVM